MSYFAQTRAKSGDFQLKEDIRQGLVRRDGFGVSSVCLTEPGWIHIYKILAYVVRIQIVYIAPREIVGYWYRFISFIFKQLGKIPFYISII